MTHAVELDPDNEVAYRLRADAYLNIGKYQLGVADLARATELIIESYTRALELNPNDLDSYVGRAEAHRFVGNNKLAVEDYTRAIELDPNDPDLYVARAWTYYQLDLYGRASSDNWKAITLDPDNPERYADRARLAFGRWGSMNLRYRPMAAQSNSIPWFYNPPRTLRR